MHLLEEYHELIEREPHEISFLWKTGQIFLYILCAISGYICSILFFLLWHDLFGGNCPLWAELELIPYVTPEFDAVDEDMDLTEQAISTTKDWKHHIIFHQKHESICKIYFIICLFSCAFGITWSLLFAMCGKGGYDVSIFDAPWRIVIPALCFNIVLAILSTYATKNMEGGYIVFSRELKKLYTETPANYKPVLEDSECNIVQAYIELYNDHEYDLCSMILGLQILSWVMYWSWTAGSIILLLRIIVISDFRLLIVRIYEISPSAMELISNKSQESQTEEHSSNQKEKKD